MSEPQPSITLQQPLYIHQVVLVVKSYSQSPWLSSGTDTKDRGLLAVLWFCSHVQKVIHISINGVIKSMKQLSFKFCSLGSKPDVVKLLHEVVKGKLGETNKARVSYCCNFIL